MAREPNRADHVELAYGLLWHMPLDKARFSDSLASKARLEIHEALGHDGRKRGIAAAKAWLNEPTDALAAASRHDHPGIRKD